MTPQPTETNRTRRLGGARIAALVSAGLIALLSAGLLAAGGWGLWGDSQRDDDGYITSDYDRYATTTPALATENLDMDLDGPAGLLDESAYGSLRLKVAPRDGKPVFAGIARTRDVEAYLGGTARDVVTDVDFSPFRVDYDRVRGKGRPAAPGSQDFWAASVEGRDAQTLTWDFDEGDWSVVVMNADGSAGVEADVSAGAKLPWLTALGWGMLGAGALGLLVAGLITVVTIRPRRPAAPAVPVPA